MPEIVDDKKTVPAEDLARFDVMLRSAGRIVAFTGAGLSTEAGIPDFRSPGGRWSRMKPILFQDFLDSDEARRETWRRRFDMDGEMRRARPTRGHRAIASWIKAGKSPAVITQNIDNLHQASGIPDDAVIEVHGNTTYAACLDCARRYEIEDLRGSFAATGEAPRCDGCGGFVKTATISFGQPMPEIAMQRATQLAKTSDLFVVVGSSLVVYPAADLPRLARKQGANVVIINREPTPGDRYAHLLLRGEIGDILGNFVLESGAKP
ncbi:NAD-dependent protein deacetylase 1 [Labrys miyagiensis]|uniref:protein acetyllysine N-acetyltransferase n=2 Tax=Labrys miyagiensis TaxID=346912 RepID=A0ABQ6CL30_9HYPH|nr:NAD-dependent protein deacetylase 1 [Labrys miyagiensis]